MQVVMGIDVGTEGTKVLLLDEKGQIVGQAYQAYSFDSPQSGWTEQDPNVWWQACLSCFQTLWDRGTKPQSIVGIGVAGQMHSSVLLDDQGEVLTKSILWNDTRTKAICDQTLQQVGYTKWQEETCNSLMPGFTLGKILWTKENLPAIYAKIAHILMPKDYIVYRLTGVLSSDVTDASGTGVFDVRHRRFHQDLLHEIGLADSLFPEVHESATIIGTVSKTASEQTRLSQQCQVIAGAADNAAAAVGLGIFSKGQGLLSIGTSGVVLSSLDQPPTKEEAALQNPTLHVFCHAMPNLWYAMGVTLSAGASLKWFREALGSGLSYDDLMEKASKVKPGSDGLLYFPFLTGERTPYNNDQLRSAFLFVHAGHQQGDFARSVIEGVAYSLRESLDIVKKTVRSIDRYAVTGGVVHSPIWLQILADLVGQSLRIPEIAEGAAYGAAMLSGLAVGWWQENFNLLFVDQTESQVVPAQNQDYYQKQYEYYQTYANWINQISVHFG